MILKVISNFSAHACVPTDSESVSGTDTCPAVKPCLGRTLLSIVPNDHIFYNLKYLVSMLLKDYTH